MEIDATYDGLGKGWYDEHGTSGEKWGDSRGLRTGRDKVRSTAGSARRGEEERTCSGKFGKDENSVSLLLACNVLVGDLLNMGEE